MSEYIPNDEIEITPEMIEAGVKELFESGRINTDYAKGSDDVLVARIFQAMMDCRHKTQQSSD
jgi:hypothetical protein